MSISEHLDSLRRHLEEAQAAAQTIAEGDPTAMSELDAEVDAMAQDVAALKSLTASTPG